METLQKRFDEKWIPVTESGCWLWTAATRRGYGVIWLNRKNEPAHRVSWEIYRGKIPEGMIICHACDVPACVNPNHLFVGTYKDNEADKIKKGRKPKGEEISNSKLTSKQVIEIRESNKTLKELGEIYGVHLSNIHLIKTRKHWSHL